jgi:hypothetical protein
MKTHFTLNFNTIIQYEKDIDEPVSNAIAILRRDMGKIFEGSDEQGGVIQIKQSQPELPEEGWIIEVTERKISVHHRDTLGCVYALLYISEHFLGVTPFWYWNDQRFCKCAEKVIQPGIIHSPVFAVRFRGWFVNDEVLIDNWSDDKETEEHWRMVFEALLRCGGNIIIPGTDENSRKNRSLAASFGLWITHHHAEPLGAEMFLRAFPDKEPSYTSNGAFFEKLWEKAVIEQKKFNVIWNLGFRGQGDRPFWADDPVFITGQQRGKAISDIIKKQVEIISRHLSNPICCINIYGETAELYRNGMLDIPSGIIKIWGDNGYGRMVSRRQGNSNPRTNTLPANSDSSPHGIYYHCSFHDLQASNHLTMSPNSMDFIAAELEKVLAANAGECWIVNSGSVKPHVHSLDLLREVWRKGQADVDEWRQCYATTYYGEGKSREMAALLSEYASCTAKYGRNEDDRAGEQLWHHPVRGLLCNWISGNTESSLRSLHWLTGETPFLEQVKSLYGISVETLPRWEAFCKKSEALLNVLDEASRRLFEDSVLLHGRLHFYGAAGTKAFCESFLDFHSGDTAKAFVLAEESYSCYTKSAEALLAAAHDKWAGYYDGDCLTDVRLTASCLEALVSYLRVLGDGTSFHKWERDLLTPAGEKKIMLLSSKQRAMTNAELAAKLRQNQNKGESTTPP